LFFLRGSLGKGWGKRKEKRRKKRGGGGCETRLEK
jgi:hypothetical protein